MCPREWVHSNKRIFYYHFKDPLKLINLKNKKIIVPGGAGFLGKYVVEKLKEIGCFDVFVPKI